MTDAHTDCSPRRISEQVSGRRPWSFVNGLSRLVVDPERFPDEREVMNSVGMGAVYTRTSTGASLRAKPRAPSRAIATLFEPYGHALADLVDDRLAATGRAVIFDLHSFPKEPLPYELFPEAERPWYVSAPTIDTPPPGCSRQRARRSRLWGASRSTSRFAAPTFRSVTTAATTVSARSCSSCAATPTSTPTAPRTARQSTDSQQQPPG